MTHICVSNLTTIGSDNGLSPGRRQAIIQTNAGMLLIEPLGTNFNEISIEIHIFSVKKMHFKMSSGKWRPSCLGLNVLKDKMVSHLSYFYNGTPYICNTWYYNFFGRLSEPWFYLLKFQFPCAFENGHPACEFRLSRGQIRWHLTSGQPLMLSPDLENNL